MGRAVYSEPHWMLLWKHSCIPKVGQRLHVSVYGGAILGLRREIKKDKI
jgi:hypothetical protein